LVLCLLFERDRSKVLDNADFTICDHLSSAVHTTTITIEREFTANMVSTTVMSALFAASLLSLTSAQDASGTYTGPLNALKTLGCYSSYQPLQDEGSYTFQSSGNCQKICVGLKKQVMGLVNGESCYCGDLLPAKADEVDDKECNTPCNGWPQDDCGGNQKWRILLSGLTQNQIPNFDPASVSSASSKTPATTVVGGSTIVVTVGPTETSGSSSGGGSNKAGIAAGVVVGLVVPALIIAGVVLWLRNRKKKAADEAYHQQQNVSNFFAGGKNTSHSSMNDTRLDPEVMMRRASDGSIADNQDYSRRILKVTNPDGF